MSRRIPTWLGILILLSPWLFCLGITRWSHEAAEAESFRHLTAANSVEELREVVGHLGPVFEFPDGSWVALRYRDSHGLFGWSSTVGRDSNGNWYTSDRHFCGLFKTHRHRRNEGEEGIVEVVAVEEARTLEEARPRLIDLGLRSVPHHPQ
jgi:hypothetical protein